MSRTSLDWSPKQRASFQRRLREWFLVHQRPLPWRQTRDPYRVLVSEVMLQQTQVATVIPYYQRFLERFPNWKALAAADEEEVLRYWQGLGYYSRARNLLRAARLVVDQWNGRSPETVEEWLQLPGVGRYTAGAVVSIALRQPAPLVDGNVARVLARLFCVSGDPKASSVQRRLWEIAAALVPQDRPDLHNVGLMELGALICLPEAPQCSRCPVEPFCAARKQGVVDRFPQTRPAPKPIRVDEVAAWTERNGRLLLTRRPPTAQWWAGLWELPRVRLEPGESPETGAERALDQTCGLSGRAKCRLTTLRHSITRYRVRLTVVACDAPEGEPYPRACAAVAWVPPDRLEAYPMASPQRRAVQRILEETQLLLSPERPASQERRNR